MDIFHSAERTRQFYYRENHILNYWRYIIYRILFIMTSLNSSAVDLGQSEDAPAYTYRVDIKLENLTGKWIQPLNKGMSEKPGVVVWEGTCIWRPHANLELRRGNSFIGKPLSSGQFQCNKLGYIKCASIIQSPDPELAMVLIIDIALNGPQSARVRLIRNGTKS